MSNGQTPRNTTERPIVLVKHDRREGALVYSGGGPTGGMLAHYFEGIRHPDAKTLAQELDARGYDVTTLRLTCRRKP